MPQRNGIRTILGGPQGEDAEIRYSVSTINELQAELDSLDLSSPEAEQRAREFFAKRLISWNWVDNDGTPLPQPHNNPDVFGELTSEEMQFVAQCVRGQAPEQVNARKK